MRHPRYDDDATGRHRRFAGLDSAIDRADDEKVTRREQATPFTRVDRNAPHIDLVGCSEKPTADETLSVRAYFYHLPHYTVDTVFKMNGQLYVDVAPATRGAFDPPDSTTYRVEQVPKIVNGETVQVMKLTEVCWHDGTRQRTDGAA
jgi:hypothetical protein